MTTSAEQDPRNALNLSVIAPLHQAREQTTWSESLRHHPSSLWAAPKDLREAPVWEWAVVHRAAASLGDRSVGRDDEKGRAGTLRSGIRNIQEIARASEGRKCRQPGKVARL